jgi:pyrroloquinoline quinone biosynthesis protein B
MAAFLRANAPWSALEPDGNVRIVELAAERPLPLGDGVDATPLLVPHRGPWSETVAFRIRGPKASVLYVPDIDRWDDWERDPADVLAEVDHALVDGTFFDPGEVPWRDPSTIRHPLVVDTLTRLGRLPAAERSKVAFVHLNHTNPLLDPASEAARRVADLGFRVARDGETIALS